MGNTCGKDAKPRRRRVQLAAASAHRPSAATIDDDSCTMGAAVTASQVATSCGRRRTTTIPVNPLEGCIQSRLPMPHDDARTSLNGTADRYPGVSEAQVSALANVHKWLARVEPPQLLAYRLAPDEHAAFTSISMPAAGDRPVDIARCRRRRTSSVTANASRTSL